jgi:UDP-N-acetylmuramoylalanine--D-glutamate ligase
MESVNRSMFGAMQRPAVLVLGLGESGLAMARWCARHGCRVRVADTRSAPPGLAALQALGSDLQSNLEFIAGPLTTSLLDTATDLIAISPGLSPLAAENAALWQAAGERGIPVWGELEFFAQALKTLAETGYQPAVLAVTGTNGKTTTTALTGMLVARTGKSVAVAGNISPSLLDKLIDAIDTASLPQVWVLELSSFQLHTAHSFAPDAATVLNLTQDHLDWHGSFDAYAAAKGRIFGANTVRVANRDDAHAYARATAGTYASLITFGLSTPENAGDYGLDRDAGMAWLVRAEDRRERLEGSGTEAEPVRRRSRAAQVEPDFAIKRLMPVDALRIRGLHNATNAMAALALCQAIGLPLAGLLHGLREYRGEPHRVELIAALNGVDFVDDSKGTNVGATVAALDGLAQRTLLIAGGEGKGQDFSPLAAPVMRWCRAVFLIGRDASLLRAALQDTGVTITDSASLDEAVQRAAVLAQPGEVVLLSPACASFDMFRSYAHRAEVFRHAVEQLAADRGTML